MHHRSCAWSDCLDGRNTTHKQGPAPPHARRLGRSLWFWRSFVGAVKLRSGWGSENRGRHFLEMFCRVPKFRGNKMYFGSCLQQTKKLRVYYGRNALFKDMAYCTRFTKIYGTKIYSTTEIMHMNHSLFQKLPFGIETQNPIRGILKCEIESQKPISGSFKNGCFWTPFSKKKSWIFSCKLDFFWNPIIRSV